jgi:hypothetical protein
MSNWPSEVENPKRLTVAGVFDVIPAKAGIQGMDPGSSPIGANLKLCFDPARPLTLPSPATGRGFLGSPPLTGGARRG